MEDYARNRVVCRTRRWYSTVPMRYVSLLLQRLREFDWILLSTVGILVAISLSSIYSIDLSRGESLTYFPTQLIALVIGVGLLFVLGSIHVSFYESGAKLFFVLSVLLLVLVLFFGVTVRGTTGWFRIFGFSFQPAEFAKVAIALMLAYVTAKQGRIFARFGYVAVTGIPAGITVALIMLQPDLGSALVIGGIWVSILIFAGTKPRYLMGLLSIIAIAFLLGWLFFFQEYQRNRLRVFIDPELDPWGAGYNVSQSLIAIGSGGLFGRGLGFGSQSQLHFLPEAQTDFIFAVIAEELGFVGVLIVFTLYVLLFWRLLRIARRAQDEFSAYMALGVTGMFFIHIVFNIGAASGLLPVTGLTLPFLSYGGSSLMINLGLIGIVQSLLRGSREPTSGDIQYLEIS